MEAQEPITILYFSDIPWEGIRQRPQHLATRLAHHHQVLWISPATLGHPFSFTPAIHPDGIARLSLPFLPFNARNRGLRKAVFLLGGIGLVRKLAGFAQRLILRRALRRCAGKQRQIWIIQNIQAAPLIRVISPDAVIYECIDHPFGFSPYPQAIRREWEEMVRDAGHLVATSPSLAAFLGNYSNRPIDVISNGVEFDHFALPSPRPAELPGDGRVIVGYVGSVYPWLDYSLIGALCQSCPEYWIVLVGPSHPSVREELFSLGRY